ncbi:MAG: PspC domain-containing protein [Melioribacteraceae bacterium]|nr:PspC domain-containing protein [Melioribacteraceae bacterium]MCO6472654.1 PspC domain-containing protein [Melioribacteraceae bacterium]MDD3558600.1 PspC domain-containing protein [Melioribacteraceae bacterium]
MAAKERLYRAKNRRVFGGVAAGLGEYLDIDPVLVRIIFIILAIINGMGIILYIVLWIVIPDIGTIEQEKTSVNTEPSSDTEANAPEEQKVKETSQSGRIVFGLILISIGAIFLLERIFPYFNFVDLIPIGFIAIGAVLVINSIKRR